MIWASSPEELRRVDHPSRQLASLFIYQLSRIFGERFLFLFFVRDGLLLLCQQAAWIINGPSIQGSRSTCRRRRRKKVNQLEKYWRLADRQIREREKGGLSSLSILRAQQQIAENLLASSFICKNSRFVPVPPTNARNGVIVGLLRVALENGTHAVHTHTQGLEPMELQQVTGATQSAPDADRFPTRLRC